MSAPVCAYVRMYICMHVCMYIFMYVCMYIYACTSCPHPCTLRRMADVSSCRGSIEAHLRVCVCVCAYVCACVHACMYACRGSIEAHLCVCVCACMHVCMCVCMHAWVHAWACMHVCMHVRTNTEVAVDAILVVRAEASPVLIPDTLVSSRAILERIVPWVVPRQPP